MSSDDVYIAVKKSALKLICSDLETNPSKAGIVRFSAPKTKLEKPYPDYDKEESQAAFDIAESAGTEIREGERFEGEEDVSGEESDEFSDYTEDEVQDSGYSSDDPEDVYSDNARDGFDSEDTYYSESDGEDEPFEAPPRPGKTSQGRGEETQNGDQQGNISKSATLNTKANSDMENAGKQVSAAAEQKFGRTRCDYQRSKESRIKRERSEYEKSRLPKCREKPPKPEREIENEEKGIRRSDRIKELRKRPRVAKSPNRFSKCKPKQRIGRPRKQVAERDNSKFEESRSRSPEKCRKASTPASASTFNRKRRSVVPNDSNGRGKRSRRANSATRVVDKGDSGERATSVPPVGAPTVKQPAAGKILRGYNKPDIKPAAAKRKSNAVRGSGDGDADDPWAPGKPYPNCDTISAYE